MDRLVGILEKEGMPALEAAISEMTSMQGTFTGSLGGEGTLQITVQGTKVTGRWNETTTNTVTLGGQTTVVTDEANATLEGDVELSSGSIAMKMEGAWRSSGGGGFEISATLSGSFTGNGYKGSANSEGETISWSVSREG